MTFTTDHICAEVCLGLTGNLTLSNSCLEAGGVALIGIDCATLCHCTGQAQSVCRLVVGNGRDGRCNCPELWGGAKGFGAGVSGSFISWSHCIVRENT